GAAHEVLRAAGDGGDVHRFAVPAGLDGAQQSRRAARSGPRRPLSQGRALARPRDAAQVAATRATPCAAAASKGVDAGAAQADRRAYRSEPTGAEPVRDDAEPPGLVRAARQVWQLPAARLAITA